MTVLGAEGIVAGSPATYRIYLNVRYDILGSKNAQLVSRDAFELFPHAGNSWNVQSS